MSATMYMAMPQVAAEYVAASPIPEFQEFPKIARLARRCIITEKIDGTNAQVCIMDDGRVFAGSRTRWITPQSDNYGFARWVEEHRDELLILGPGHHFGEWWGQGIQRTYGEQEKHFSLFNVGRWSQPGATLPSCVSLVPVLYEGLFVTHVVEDCLNWLRQYGSHAAPGFMQPEGIVVYHAASGQLFKKTLEKDEEPKTKAAKEVAEAMAKIRIVG
jgi:hypothetical protein